MLRSLYALSIISGTAIGVGLFPLPFLTLQLGPWIILGYFVVVGIIAILIHYFFTEIALQTKDFIRLPGFVKIYLGDKFYKLSLISGILGMYGACLAYLIVGGEFLAAILIPVLGGNVLIYTFFYFILGSFIIYTGIRTIGKIQFWGLIIFFLSLIGIYLRGRNYIDLSNIFVYNIDWNYLFVPYGVILFSLWALSLIPEAEEALGDERHLLKKIVPIAIIIPIAVYLIFIFLILGITGPNTTESALTGIQKFFGDGIAVIVLFFGVVTTFTSFISLGLTVKKVFWYDLKIGRNLSWFLASFVPITLFLLGFRDLIKIIAIVGAVMLAIDGFLVTLMYQKIKPYKFKYLTYTVMIALVIGALSDIVYTIFF